ncbi:MAG TPA: GrdX protein [Firmicutes bacterium]|nr:GrdX protein [Bacillota bacterium]
MTNNTSVSLLEQDCFVTGTLLHVLIRCRDLVHQGHLLVSHPLVSSVKPNETPYKSVVLSKKRGGQVDFQSLSIIEASLKKAEQMLSERPLPNYSERVLEDFQFIDRDLLETGLASLPGNL